MGIANLMRGESPRLYDSDGNEVGLTEVCEWWVNAYPANVFIKEPVDIVNARKCMERLLATMEKKADKKQVKLQ